MTLVSLHLSDRARAARPELKVPADAVSITVAAVKGSPSAPAVMIICANAYNECVATYEGYFDPEVSVPKAEGASTLPSDPDSRAPSMPVALEEQLGLRLVRQTAPYEVLVIESVEMPTAS